jgi:oxygen-independent coproporphyrinogen-3 oxidase
MLALRTTAGAELSWLGPAAAREVEELVRRRLAVVRKGRLVLTSRGMDLHSAVAERLVE